LLLEIVSIRRLGQFLQVSPPIMAAGLAVEEMGLFPINLGGDANSAETGVGKLRSKWNIN